MSLFKIVIAVLVVLHIVSAVAGSAVLSTIPEKNLPAKYLFHVMCWVCPCFGALFFVKGGKLVPSFGSVGYAVALEMSKTEYDANSATEDLKRSLRKRSDSGYGSSSGTNDLTGGDGGE